MEECKGLGERFLTFIYSVPRQKFLESVQSKSAHLFETPSETLSGPLPQWSSRTPPPTLPKGLLLCDLNPELPTHPQVTRLFPVPSVTCTVDVSTHPPTVHLGLDPRHDSLIGSVTPVAGLGSSESFPLTQIFPNDCSNFTTLPH